jgi:hypothetical protein
MDDSTESPSTRQQAWLRVAGRTARWALAALIVGLVIPAATQQWNDVEREQDIKAGLIKELSSSSADAVTQGGYLVDTAPGETSPEFRRVVATWRAASYGMRGEISAYFSRSENPEHSSLVAAMSKYGQLVEDYIAVSASGGKDTRALASYRRNNKAFIEDISSPALSAIVPKAMRKTLENPPRPAGASYTTDVRDTWGTAIIVEGGAFSQVIQQAHPHGFHTTWQDFVGRVLWPF